MSHVEAMDPNDNDLFAELVEKVHKVQIEQKPNGMIQVTTHINTHGDLMIVERQRLGKAVNVTVTHLDWEVLRHGNT